jgi:DNA-directed RNA polymerase subunit RPC12/RpoP
MFFLVMWIVLFGALGAVIGERKGIGGQGFAVGVLLGPLGVLFVLAASGNRVRCPACRELVDPAASVCPHCQHQIAEPPNAVCTFCHRGFRVSEAALGHAVRCPNCKKLTQARKPDLPAPHPAAGPP